MRKRAHSPRTLHSGRYIVWIINKSKHNYEHCADRPWKQLVAELLSALVKVEVLWEGHRIWKKISHLYWHLFSKVKKESLKSKVLDRILHNLNLAQLTQILRNPIFCVKVQIFWERHKILKKSPHFFDITYYWHQKS